MQDVKLTDVKLQDIKLSHISVVLLCYISDRMFNSLLSTTCFDELFFAFVSDVVCTFAEPKC